ncbi:MAG: hypothetical protein LM558_00470 [Thermosphaera sp.]|nr:hypothetical protein [Thermosphaera sp.]
MSQAQKPRPTKSQEDQSSTKKTGLFIYTMAKIAEVFYNAGLRSSVNEFFVNMCCQKLLQEYPEMGACTMYDYFLRCEETPFAFEFCSDSYSVDKWGFAIDMLKAMIKLNKIHLGGIKAKIYISTDSGHKFYMLTFSGDKKRDIKRLNKLKKLANPSLGTCTYIDIYSNRLVFWVGLP